MPLNRNAPYGTLCGYGQPFNATYEQNGLFFDAKGQFLGPPDKEDAFFDPQPDPNAPQLVFELRQRVEFLEKLIAADFETLSEMSQMLGMRSYGKIGEDTLRKKVLEAWKDGA